MIQRTLVAGSWYLRRSYIGRTALIELHCFQLASLPLIMLHFLAFLLMFLVQ